MGESFRLDGFKMRRLIDCRERGGTEDMNLRVTAQGIYVSADWALDKGVDAPRSARATGGSDRRVR